MKFDPFMCAIIGLGVFAMIIMIGAELESRERMRNLEAMMKEHQKKTQPDIEI